MEVLLVVGGAYAGKRKIVKERVDDVGKSLWISAYGNEHWTAYDMKWSRDRPLVLEGWEKWILEECNEGQKMSKIRQTCTDLITTLYHEEQKCGCPIVLIMLEMGRGIVPLESQQRKQRDVAGWVLQDAAKLADEVLYVWNGLAKRIN
jgi:adenosylcobinamide kinase/adenosylcobinamide-phosphate guanylyltransferase